MAIDINSQLDKMGDVLKSIVERLNQMHEKREVDDEVWNVRERQRQKQKDRKRDRLREKREKRERKFYKWIGKYR